jgi:hypothetical protein
MFTISHSTVKDEKVARTDNLREKLRPMPPRGRVAIHVPGVILNDIISLGDKPGGIEPGLLFYIRDKNYYALLQAVLDDDLNAKITLTGHEHALDKLYQQYLEKCEHEKPKPLEILSKEAYLNQGIAAGKAALSAIWDIEDLEKLFPSHPVLFAIIVDLIEEKNKKKPVDEKITAWMIKLDFKDPAHLIRKFLGIKRVAPSRRRAEKTTTAKKKGEAAKNKALKKGLTLAEAERAQKIAVKKHAKLYNAARWIAQGNRVSQSVEAVREVVATNHARMAGLDCQMIQCIDGQWQIEDGAPKVLIAAVWEKGFSTFDELKKGKGTLPGLEFRGGENLSEANYLAYEKSPGRWASASHLIPHLGKNLALFLRHGDRDAIGKIGQNKGISFDEAGNPRLFGIDFGKSFKLPKLLDSLQDDFSFLQPSQDDGKNLVNYALFYDTPYVDRMAGIHILAKQHGLGLTLPEHVKQSFASIWDNEEIKADSHLLAFETEIAHYRDLMAQAVDKLREDGIPSKERLILKKKVTSYQKIIKAIEKMREVSIRNDEKILAVFSSRLLLTDKEVSLLDNLEKLIATQASHLSKNGEVALNHLHVDRQDRIPVQFQLDPSTRDTPPEQRTRITLVVGGDGAKKSEALRKMQELLVAGEVEGILVDAKNGTLSFPGSEFLSVCSLCSEENIKNKVETKNKPIRFMQSHFDSKRNSQKILGTPTEKSTILMEASFEKTKTKLEDTIRQYNTRNTAEEQLGCTHFKEDKKLVVYQVAHHQEIFRIEGQNDYQTECSFQKGVVLTAAIAAMAVETAGLPIELMSGSLHDMELICQAAKTLGDKEIKLSASVLSSLEDKENELNHCPHLKAVFEAGLKKTLSL